MPQVDDEAPKRRIFREEALEAYRHGSPPEDRDPPEVAKGIDWAMAAVISCCAAGLVVCGIQATPTYVGCPAVARLDEQGRVEVLAAVPTGLAGALTPGSLVQAGPVAGQILQVRVEGVLLFGVSALQAMTALGSTAGSWSEPSYAVIRANGSMERLAPHSSDGPTTLRIRTGSRTAGRAVAPRLAP